MSFKKTPFIRYTAALSVAAVLFFCLWLTAFAQVKDPGLPLSPDVEFENGSKSSVKYYQAEIKCAGSTMAGDIYLTTESFRDINGKGDVYYWQDISSIRMLEWVRRVKGKSWIFYPESYEVTLKNSTKLRVGGNIRELNRFRLISSRKQRTMYSYYYDDYVKGKWTNTGLTDFYHPSDRPAAGCVTEIIFR